MSVRRILVALVAAAVGCAASACGHSPEPAYYALAPTREATPGAGSSWAKIVKVRRPVIAGYLDRAEIVTGVADYRLRVTSGESWGEPLDDMIGRVLAQDLGERLRGTVVFSDSSPMTAPPDATVSLDIERFDAGEDGTVHLRGAVAVESPRGHRTVATRAIDLRLRPPSAGTSGLVAAMSHLLEQLADQLAPDLRGSAPGAGEETSAGRPDVDSVDAGATPRAGGRALAAAASR